MISESYTGEPVDDLERLAESIERLRPHLRLIAARRLRDWGTAEDVAQEAIRRTLEAARAGTIRDIRALPGFLIQTVVNVCRQWTRTSQREKGAMGKYAAQPLAHLDDALSTLIASDRKARVRRAFEQLGEEDREVLSLTYLESVSTADIAERLKLTGGHVRVRRHRALKRLAEVLGVTRDREGRLK